MCKSKTARPRVAIPVFPGTNCEYDSARACLRAGLEPEIVVVRNPDRLPPWRSRPWPWRRPSARPRSCSCPAASPAATSPTARPSSSAPSSRNGRLTDAVHDLLKRRDGLMLGICNGFQALIKLGLVPYGEIRAMDEGCPTLTFNTIGRHQSRYVTTRVASVQSPGCSSPMWATSTPSPSPTARGRFTAPRRSWSG